MLRAATYIVFFLFALSGTLGWGGGMPVALVFRDAE